MVKEYWYDEKNIERVMIEWFESQGFGIDRETYKRGGIDIKAIKREIVYLVEVKGYPRPKKNNNSRNAQKRNWFTYAVGQICTRMERENDWNINYALAFPDFKYYETKALKIKNARKRLGLEIFLVSEFGRLRKLAPDSNRFENLDTFFYQERLF